MRSYAFAPPPPRLRDHLGITHGEDCKYETGRLRPRVPDFIDEVAVLAKELNVLGS